MGKVTNKAGKFFALQTSTQIYDNTQLVLSRCRKIYEYNDIYLKADAGNVIVEIWGDKLTIDDFANEGIYVYGRIDSVSFTANNRYNKENDK